MIILGTPCSDGVTRCKAWVPSKACSTNDKPPNAPHFCEILDILAKCPMKLQNSEGNSDYTTTPNYTLLMSPKFSRIQEEIAPQQATHKEIPPDCSALRSLCHKGPPNGAFQIHRDKNANGVHTNAGA